MKALRKNWSIILFSFLMVSCQNSSELFQENTDDWHTEGDATWDFTEDVLIGNINGGAGFAITEKAYKNFMLELEFYPDSTVNSGVFIRCKNNEISAVNCYEINIWDLHPNQDFRTGSIVTKAHPLAYLETIDKWNTYKITIEKSHIQVWLNDTLTADYYDEELKEGFIGLQAAEKGEIKFRNIKIKIPKYKDQNSEI